MKDELKKAVLEILHRVDEAGRGARNVDDWYDAEDNYGAPEGVSYNEWIEEAQYKALALIEKL